MKIVLLPGLDGTGNLFADFLEVYDGEFQIIPLPTSENQSYEHLAKKVIHFLPNEEFILVAESFSGGLVTHLIEYQAKYIKGIIFIASFISVPNKIYIAAAKLLPIKLLAKMPGSTFIYKLMFLGFNASNNLIDQFKQIINQIPNAILKKRLSSMYYLMPLPHKQFDLPCIYIQPNNDKLVPKSKYKEIQKIFTNTQCYHIDGPHFILQSKPMECKTLIKRGIKYIINSPNKAQKTTL